MKTRLLCLFLIWGMSNSYAASAKDYVRAVERISDEYHQQSRDFLRSLNPQQQNLTAAQQVEFCGILGRYVDQLYRATDKNREALDFQLQKLTRQDIVDQVKSSKMMQLLQSKNVNCNL
ncbi:hypothetical protein ABLT80_02945 [Acinetobacter schindleri]|jgi:hypothetical protein|uniref:hypothetical protein n=1 Tax=Acinetobacter schindleri TaxID=108981 RepID=UPI0021CD5A4F|nr:hypothetical protein [Acinetobacter schindleri]MCU4324521.1 hypothetical protein [Acinetobacter schindleri]